MNSTLRTAAFGLAMAAAALPIAAYADDPSTGGKDSGVSIDELNKEFQSLSPEARDALMRQLEQRGVDSLSHMSESDARSSFATLPPAVRTELQAKWDAMSDEQHEALKQLSPDKVKQLVEDKVKASIKEAIKPPPAVMAAGTAIAVKSKAFVQKTQDLMHQIWAKVTGKQDVSEQPAGSEANGN